jgi:hypothetical protein
MLSLGGVKLNTPSIQYECTVRCYSHLYIRLHTTITVLHCQCFSSTSSFIAFFRNLVKQKHTKVLYKTGTQDKLPTIVNDYGYADKHKDWWMDDRGTQCSIPSKGRVSSSLQHSDQLWSPPSLPSNGYQGLFPRGKAAGA